MRRPRRETLRFGGKLCVLVLSEETTPFQAKNIVLGISLNSLPISQGALSKHLRLISFRISPLINGFFFFVLKTLTLILARLAFRSI